MYRIILSVTMLIAASLIFTSCGAPAGNNAPANNANKAANAANTAAAPAADKATSEGEIKKLLGDISAALTKGDTDALAKMWSDNYAFVGPDGSVTTKAQRLDAMKSGQFKYESLTLSDEQIRLNPENTGAIVIGKAAVKGVMQGKPVEGDFRVTQVIVKGKDGWQVVTGQSTKIEAGAAPAKADDKKADEKKSDDTKPAAPANK